MNTRQKKIIELLKLNSCEISELAKLFEVSEKTIKNDIDYLRNVKKITIINNNKIVYIPLEFLVESENYTDDLYSCKLQVYILLCYSPVQISYFLNYSKQKIYFDTQNLESKMKLLTPLRLLNPIILLSKNELEIIYTNCNIKGSNKSEELIKKIYSNNSSTYFKNSNISDILSVFKDIESSNFEQYEQEAYKLSTELRVNIENVLYNKLNDVDSYYLFQHIKSNYVYLKYNLEREFSNFTYIYHKYSENLKTVCMIIKSTLKNHGLSVIENQVLFIAIHFLKVSRPKEVVLVCESGYSTAFILKKQLEQYFTNFKITGILPKSEIENLILYDKLVVSTVPLQKVDALEVSSQLTKEDIDKLKQHLEINQRPMDKASKLYELYKPLFKRNITYNIFLEYYEGKIDRPMLNDLLTEKYIQQTTETMNWQYAIEKAAQPLVKNNKIEQRYVDAMINSIVVNGPYVCFTDKFAMPHARPEDGVNETSMSLLISKNPVDFAGKQVQVFVVLASADNDSHLLALTQLTEYISDPAFIEDLIKSTTKQEVIERIQL